MRVNDRTGPAEEADVDPVGRQGELGTLRAALDDAARGLGRVVLVTGEPGIGKSTVVDAFRSYAASMGATWLWGTAWEDLGAPAYWPWTQVIRAAGRVSPTSVAVRTKDLGPLGPAGPTAEAPQQFVLYDAVADLLASLSEQAPVVVVLEDLHAAGVAAARLLEFVARCNRHARLMLIGTFRPAEAAADRDLAAVLARVGEAGTSLALAPFGSAEIDAVMEAAQVPTSPSLATEIAERTQGNPLFVTHIVRTLAAGGSAADAGLPLGLRNAFRRQAERASFGGDVPEALAAAAVVGIDLSLDILSAVLDSSKADLRPVLEGAVAAGLLRGDRTDPDRYEFTHAVVREALYDEINGGRRSELHLQTGHALAAAGVDAGRLAHHFSLAWPAGGAVEAAHHCRLAGLRATSAHAHAEAVQLFRDALAALARIPDATPTDRCGLLVDLAAAQFRAGRPGDARVTARLANEVAESIDDADLISQSALLLASNLPFNAVAQEAISALRRADECWRNKASARRAAVLARLAGVTAPVDRGAAETAAQRAEAVATALGDDVAESERRSALAAALASQLEVGWGKHEPAQARIIARRMVDTADNTSDAAAAAIWDAVFSLELGDIPAAEAAIDSLERLADQDRQPSLRHLALSRRATLTILRGEYETGLRLARAAREVAVDADLADADAVWWGQLFAVWRQTGLEPDDAAHMERIARDLSEHSPFAAAHRAAVVQMLLARGDTHDGRRLFDGLSATLDRLEHDLLYIWTLTLLGESAVQLEDVVAGGAIYDRLLPFAGRFVVAAGCVVCLGSTSHQLGQLAQLIGRTELAREHFQQARDAHDIAGCDGLAAMSQRALDAVAQPSSPSFEDDGQVVTARFAREVARLPTSLGLRYLALLIASPGVDIEATQLVALAPAGGNVRRSADLRGSEVRTADEILDRAALASYRARLADLDAEREEAALWNDGGRAERLEEERAFILHELSRAVGLGGRKRRFPDEAERARVNVTRAIRSAIRKLEPQAPGLSAHLDRCVTTGGRCRYLPDLGPSS